MRVCLTQILWLFTLISYVQTEIYNGLYLSLGLSNLPGFDTETYQAYTDLGHRFGDRLSANAFNHISLTDNLDNNPSPLNTGVGLTVHQPIRQSDVSIGPFIGVSQDGLNAISSMMHYVKAGLTAPLSLGLSISIEARYDLIRYDPRYSDLLNNNRFYLTAHFSGFLSQLL